MIKSMREMFGARARQTLYAVLCFSLTPCLVLGQTQREASSYKGWTVVSFSIEGLTEDMRKDLKRGLAIPSQIKRFRSRGPVFYPHVLTDDMKRARLYMAQRGYPNATVKARFRPQPKSLKLSVIVEVTPGTPVRIESISLEGFPSTFDRSTVPVPRAGSIFSDDEVAGAAAALESHLRTLGFARARVDWSLQATDSSRVRLRFTAEPGQRRVFGKVHVQGTSSDLVPLVRRTAAVKEGTPYSPGLVQQAQNNIRLLDLYRQARLNIRDAQGDTVDLHADLIPRKPRSIETGIGYWTDDLVRLRAQWAHRNLFRGGRGLSVKASASRFLQRGVISAWWPALLAARSREALSLSVENQREESYRLLSVGAEAFSNYRYSISTTARFGIALSDINVSVESRETSAFVQQGGLLTVLSLRWNRNASDDRLSPTRGTVTWVNTEWAPNGFLSDNHYALLETAGALYLPLPLGVVAASRLQVGVAKPTGGSQDLLPNKRFYSGGASSMRGFQRRKLGPLDAEGAALGGEAKLEASVELRYPFLWRFRGALFVDSGQVWRTIDDVVFDELEVAVGPGLRLKTPVGPIRADLGWRVTNKEATQRRWAFHLSVGQPF